MIGLIYCAGILLLGGALCFVLNLPAPWMDAKDVHAELVKVGTQVVVFGLAGGAIKLLLDRQTERRKFRSDMLERLGRVHKGVYRVRRLLPNSQPDQIPQLLGELMDARQDLGATIHMARVWGFGSTVRNVQRETEIMRKYLEKVVVGALSSEDAPERASYLAFLEWRAPGPYEETFKSSYLSAKKLLDPSFEVQPK